mgnify:FL=1
MFGTLPLLAAETNAAAGADAKASPEMPAIKESAGEKSEPSVPVILKNGSMEADANADAWPDDWPKNKDASFVEEDGNHFLRLTSPEPGATVLLYQKLPIPEGTEALEMTWRQRVPDLKPGTQAWYDARIMIEFRNDADEKLPDAPPAPYARSASKEWTDKSIQFLVPKDATFLVLMPALFQVESGTLELDDFAIKKVEAAPLQPPLLHGRPKPPRCLRRRDRS